MRDNFLTKNSREAIIIRTGALGIVANVLLAIAKVSVGLLSHSLIMILDALNNTSDVFSSIVTILGAKLGAKEPDREHPQGHGRYEYIAAFLISGFIFYAGVTALTESVNRILHPEIPDYSYFALLLIGVSIVVKILLSRYMRKVGEKVGSESLQASGKDAFFDAMVSFCALLSVVANTFGKMNFVEGYLALFLSVFYIYSGIRSLQRNISTILGERVKPDVSLAVMKIIHSYPEVKGVYDLIFTDYGPDKFRASVRIEVDEKMNALEIDTLSRALEKEIFKETGIPVMAIGIYADCEADKELQEEVSELILSYPAVLQVHGFHIHGEELRCEVVISLEEKNREMIFADIRKELGKRYPKFKVNLTLDGDISDIL